MTIDFVELENKKTIHKLRAGKFLKPVEMWMEGDHIFFKFGFNRALMSWIKALEGAKWWGYDELNPRKLWSVKNSQHNQFQLRYLAMENPYSRYQVAYPDIQLDENGRLPCFEHQVMMVKHAMRGKQVIFACEMGTGKSRAFIEIMELIAGLQHDGAWYVGPRSGVRAVGRELIKWNAKIRPEMMTYNGLVKALEEWIPGTPPPRLVCFDESSKIKNPNAQRSQAAMYLANAMREYWGEDCYIIEMSGTPAPRTPDDWWHQAEVACPGFVKEGTKHKFKARLCIIEMQESIAGAKYPKVIAWLDDPKKCAVCGQMSDDPKHTRGQNTHRFEASTDEVSHLYKRMKGLVLVQFKKNCLDLPEKQYKVIKVKPSPEILRAAKLIRVKTTRAVTALMQLRELSDGFQYVEEVVGKEQCPNCGGEGMLEAPVPIDPVKQMEPQDIRPENFENRIIQCPLCDGTKTVDKKARQTHFVPCPKDDVFIELLDEHEDIGRFIVWGGFKGTVDRLVEIAQKQGWYVLRVDGRGYHGLDPMGEEIDDELLLSAMDATDPRSKELFGLFSRVCWVGQPGAGGTAHTLTASPTMLYYSNTFNGEDRMQSEDRNHRPGMDVNRGATVIDLVHLQSDLLVLKALKDRRRLQNLTMGNLEEVFNGE